MAAFNALPPGKSSRCPPLCLAFLTAVGPDGAAELDPDPLLHYYRQYVCQFVFSARGQSGRGGVHVERDPEDSTVPLGPLLRDWY